MVSFWPWKGDDSSPASFEKALSTLSTKIADSQARLDRLRTTSRRVRVLWMLYLSFAYLIYSIVLMLVVGYPQFSASDWTGVALGPVLIYVTRLAITFYFNFRIENVSAQLKQQQDERTKTIQKLKDTTKYDSTLQLLEKYGGQAGKASEAKSKAGPREGEGQDHGKPQSPGQRVPGRTTMPPPATANIQRREGLPSSPAAPQAGLIAQPTDFETSAKFAPAPLANTPQLYAQARQPDASPNWYDRVLDLLLGEDETAAKNRIVLICQSCRQVNGQAPPGTKTLAELGVWKCMTCGASNGELNEGKRLVKEVLDAQAAEVDALAPGEEFKEDDDDDEVEGEALDVGQEEVGPDGRSTGKHSESGTRKRRGRKG